MVFSPVSPLLLPVLLPSSKVLLKDHVNLMGMHPLIGPNDPIGLRFVDMVDAYDPKLRTVMLGACA